MAITVKQASQAAGKYMKELVGEPFGVAVEEVEKSKDGRHWLITLGYYPNIFTSKRAYRILTVDAETGKVESMKIRKME